MLQPRPLSLGYLEQLTDDFGIWQHSRGQGIDRRHGYSLDDNARALLVAIDYGRLDLAKIYLSYLNTSCQSDPISNFFDKERAPLPKEYSEDALGEAYWSLAVAHQQPELTTIARPILERISPHVYHFQSIRGQAYALLGAQYYNQELLHKYVNSIKQSYAQYASPDWEWPEDCLTYANAIIPYALLEADEIDLGLRLLTFLNTKTVTDTMVAPVGNRGWYPRQGVKAEFDQQPIDVAYLLLANISAYQLTKKTSYRKAARLALQWFWGKNQLNMSLISLERESCLDGLNSTGVSKNQGSENIICYLLAQAAILRDVPELLP